MDDFLAFQTVLELRRYTTVPGRRDDLVALFEREFVESQEAVGARLYGQFTEPAEPGKFLWLRGFRDMESRRAALGAFYTGPVWRRHSAAANATMTDSSDVLLLRPAGPGFPAPAEPRPPVDADDVPSSRLAVTICHPVGPGFAEFFAETVRPVLAEAGAPPPACFETEPAENTFPRLPVREGETVFVWFTRFAGEGAVGRFDTMLESLPAWGKEVLPQLNTRLSRPFQRLVLAPTPRSLLR
ncbi:NIPSNAP family protein [Amycolatopsis sp. NPDC059027]|uniref:NIPSNAP family protein n=1 Tax=Amycolatopsis sp. NPDC059027 TaxID=3346709 RepID=UPI00366B013D